MFVKVRRFSRYVPDNILKPKPEDWGTGLCKVCLNPELKVEVLKDSNVTIEWLLSHTNEELQDFEKSLSTNHLITCKGWQLQPVTKKKLFQNTTEQSKEINVQAKSYRSAKNVVTET